MNRTLFLSSLLACAVIVPFVGAACSSSDRQFAPEAETPSFVEPEAGTPPPPPKQCGKHCSRDLKSVLDGCDGAETVVEQCNADQGCAVDACVDACTATEVSKGSVGCNFYTLPPDDPTLYKGSCFAAL